MADIDALQHKHRLFTDGQMLITKRETTAFEDVQPEEWETPKYTVIPAKTPLMVISEGTSKSNQGMASSIITMRSIKVLYTPADDGGEPVVKKIMINPLYGPKDIARMFTFAPAVQDQCK